MVGWLNGEMSGWMDGWMVARMVYIRTGSLDSASVSSVIETANNIL